MKTQKLKFNKAILLVGAARSGKSRLAFLTKKENSFFVSGKTFRHERPIKYLTQGVDQIIFDDLHIRKIKDLIFRIENGFTVKSNKPLIYSVIHPQIIVTCDCTIRNLKHRYGNSLDYHFDIFELNGCNDNAYTL